MKSKFLAVVWLILAYSPFGYADVISTQLKASDVSFVERNNDWGIIITSYFGGKRHKFSVNTDEGKDESQNFSEVKLQLTDNVGSVHKVKAIPTGTICTSLGYPDDIYNCVAVITQQSPANSVGFSMFGVDSSGQEIKLAEGDMPELSAEIDGEDLVIKVVSGKKIKLTQINGDDKVSTTADVRQIDLNSQDGCRLPLVLTQCAPENSDTDFLNAVITLKCDVDGKPVFFRIGIRCICSVNPDKLDKINQEIENLKKQKDDVVVQIERLNEEIGGLNNETKAVNNETSDYGDKKAKTLQDVDKVKSDIKEEGYKIQEGGLFSRKITEEDVKKEAEEKQNAFDAEREHLLNDSVLGKDILRLQNNTRDLEAEIVSAKDNSQVIGDRNREKEETLSVMSSLLSEANVDVDHAGAVLKATEQKHEAAFRFYNTTKDTLEGFDSREKFVTGNSTLIKEVTLPEVESWIVGNSTQHNELQVNSDSVDISKQRPSYEKAGKAYAKKHKKCDVLGEQMLDAIPKK